MITDTCICPDCQTTLDVELYGHNLECSECGCKLAVFPDSAIRVDIPVGTLWITLPENWGGI
uniref:Uncharacterized protein n=1 Tax=viral metagenome TaxID=1070528 RepID=A0A6H1ZV21_9ZZZZ